ncbi:MAG: LysR family transcriptional regulator, partial [Rhodobacteraceae bacterium]
MTQIDDLNTLLAVVDHGSFSAAARALGQTPSAVGKRVALLETRLGVVLLHRSTRRMALTAAGRHYAEEAREIVARLAALEDDIAAGADSLRGPVRMTAPIAFGRARVAPALVAFMRQHRKVEIALSLTDRNVDLTGEGMDLAVRTGDLSDSALIARRVMGYARLICATPDYLRAWGAPEHPGELARHRCLTLAQEWQ